MNYDENSTVLKVRISDGDLSNIRLYYMYGTNSCSSIDWGDGTVEDYKDFNNKKDERGEKYITHFYEFIGDFIIEIKDCKCYNTGTAYHPNFEIIEIIQESALFESNIHGIGLCHCRNIKHINLTFHDNIENLTWYGHGCENLETVNLVLGKGIKSCRYIFNDCRIEQYATVTFNAIPERADNIFNYNRDMLELYFDESLDKDEIMEFTKKVVSGFVK